MTLLFGIITILLILTVLVVFHEFGHFLTARLFKVRVFEFGVGWPPRILGIWSGKEVIKTTRIPAHSSYHPSVGDVVKINAFRDADDKMLYADNIWVDEQHPDVPIGDDSSAELVVGKVREVNQDSVVVASMRWTINALPIGGFVKMLGENDTLREGSLASKSYFARISVITAGVIINALLPFIIFPIVELLPAQRSIGPVEIEYVLPNSAAEAGNLEAGDVVVSIEGETIDERDDIRTLTLRNLNSETAWVVMRDAQTLTLFITPSANPPDLVVGTDITLEDATRYFEDANVGDTLMSGAVGIVTMQPVAQMVTEGKPLLEAILDGWRSAIDTINLIFQGLASIFSGATNPLNSLVGPIGAGQIAGGIIDADVTVLSRVRALLLFAAVISFSLAIFNLLPFPPLDGGQLLFILLQMVNRGKRLPSSVPRTLNLLGFVLFITLAIYIAFNDVFRITGS